MHPVLFHAFGEPIHAYVVFSVVAYATAIAIGLYLGWRDGRPFLELLEVALVAVLSGMLMSKLFHTVFEARGHHLSDGSTASGVLELLRDDPWHWARLFESGYVFYGGPIGGALGVWALAVRRGLPDKGAFGDYTAPGLALAIFFGRIGCFLAGCCYGKETSLPWAVSFPAAHPSHGALIHPVQLVDASFGLIAFVAIVALWDRRRFAGEAMAGLAFAYAVFRFLTEALRADADRGVWLGGSLSTSQLVSIAAVPIVLLLWRRALRLAKMGTLPAPKRLFRSVPPAAGTP